jgi:hypothetical protein
MLSKTMFKCNLNQSTANYSSGQHRGNIREGQLHLRRDNLKEFAKYESRSTALLQAIRDAYKRQRSQ